MPGSPSGRSWGFCVFGLIARREGLPASNPPHMPAHSGHSTDLREFTMVRPGFRIAAARAGLHIGGRILQCSVCSARKTPKYPHTHILAHAIYLCLRYLVNFSRRISRQSELPLSRALRSRPSYALDLPSLFGFCSPLSGNLIGTGEKTEFAVTISKDRVKKILTGTDLHFLRAPCAAPPFIPPSSKSEAISVRPAKFRRVI